MRILRESEDIIRLELVAGPGAFTIQGSQGYPDLYDDPYKDGINEVNKRLSEDEDLNDEEGLAKYSDIEGLTCIRPTNAVRIGHEFFTNWEAYIDKKIYDSDPSGVLKKIGDFIAGQSSDGWGEGFEQDTLYMEEGDSSDEEDDDEDQEVCYHPYGKFYTHKNFTVKIIK